VADPDAPPDPQGQAALADRVRLRGPARRGLREHAPGGARPDRPRRQRDRIAQRARPAPRHRRRTPRLRLKPRELALDGGFSPTASPRTCPAPTAYSSPAANPPALDAPTAASPDSGSASRAASATSSAATASNAPASRPPRHDNLDGLGDPRLQPRHPRHLSQAGFDGDLDSRVPSLGRGSLQAYGPSEEVSGRAA
jgi:hypothetical protein